MSTNDWHHFKVVSNDPTANKNARVEMDGKRLEGVVEVSITTSVGHPNKIVLTMLAASINKDGVALPVSENGKYDAEGNFIHDKGCFYGAKDHVGMSCGGPGRFVPDASRLQKVDEPYHEWHQRVDIERDESCWDCNPPSEGDA